jgi:hypothetical protein
MFEKKTVTKGCPIRKYWLGIGQEQNFKQTNDDYKGEFQ